MSKFTLVCCIAVCAFLTVAHGDGDPYASLKQTILQNYDAQVRPGSPDAPIQVQMRLMVNAIRVEEENIALHADAWPLLLWEDHRLKWDPASYSGISSLRLPASTVWIPDIVLQNEIPTSETSVSARQYSVVAYSNGTILWVPSISLMAACSLDLANFPKDSQKCTMMFGSWTHDKTEIDVKLFDEPIKMDYIVNTSPWVVVDVTAEEKDMVYPNVEGVYPALIFNFSLERRQGTYCITLYLPILVSVFASIASWLVSKHGASGAELLIGSLINSVILFATIFYHGKLLGISEQGVPSVLQFVGALIALEALTLPLKTMHSSFAKRIQKGLKKGIAKPIPHLASSIINFNFFRTSKTSEGDIMTGETVVIGDKASLLRSEGTDTRNNQLEWTRLANTIWATLAYSHALGVVVAATMLLTGN